MAYYTALITAWNGTPSPPAGVTGLTLVGQTTTEKLIRINAWTVPAPAQRAILPVSTIINAMDPTEFDSLVQLQVSKLQVLFMGGAVEALPNIRAMFQKVFNGKPVTLGNLQALVAPFDNPVQPWWPTVGYTSPISVNDLVAAGGLT